MYYVGMTTPLKKYLIQIKFSRNLFPILQRKNVDDDDDVIQCAYFESSFELESKEKSLDALKDWYMGKSHNILNEMVETGEECEMLYMGEESVAIPKILSKWACSYDETDPNMLSIGECFCRGSMIYIPEQGETYHTDYGVLIF